MHHNLKSGRAKYRGGPKGPKSGRSGPIASTTYELRDPAVDCEQFRWELKSYLFAGHLKH